MDNATARAEIDFIIDQIVDMGNVPEQRDLIHKAKSIRSLFTEPLDGGISDLNGDVESPEKVRESFIPSIMNGDGDAETTYIACLDKIWRWKQREFNIWTGYNGDGKSEFLNFITLLKVMNDPDAKACFFSPENYPTTDFYRKFVHTILGHHPKYEEDHGKILSALDTVLEKILFVYPDNADFTIKNIERIFRQMIDQEGVNICVLDPYAKISHQYGGMAEHHYVAQFMMERIAFARKQNISYHLIAHQLTAQTIFEGPRKDYYREPDGYRIKGGGTFADSADNVLTVFRPSKPVDFSDPTVEIKSVKIKKQPDTAKPGKISLGV